MSEEKKVVKRRQGFVTSDVQDKTIVVSVRRKTRHKKYKKVVYINKKYYAHDENNEARKGDEVLIEETKPSSKLKRWQLTQITKKAN